MTEQRKSATRADVIAAVALTHGYPNANTAPGSWWEHKAEPVLAIFDALPADRVTLAEADGDKLRTLATWFDDFDDWREATGKIAPGITDYREVQGDLRRMAAIFDALPADPPASAGHNHAGDFCDPLTCPWRPASVDAIAAGTLDVAVLAATLREHDGPQRESIAPFPAARYYREWAERLAAIYERRLR